MSARTLILASASPARLRLLQDAGIDPKVVVTDVLEDDTGLTAAAEIVGALARRKARAASADGAGALVLGCDSLLDIDGNVFGKPASERDATEQWRRMRRRTGTLVTGHCLIDTSSGACAERVASTRVRFGNPTDAEIDAYVATGEPLRVAGGFTVLGGAAPFIEGIDGDPGTVLGCSLPVLRQLLRQLGVEITDLWS
jgi:septum formation protein